MCNDALRFGASRDECVRQARAALQQVLNVWGRGCTYNQRGCTAGEGGSG